eukprot:9059038-Pyramimonas_sp.AAC.1
MGRKRGEKSRSGGKASRILEESIGHAHLTVGRGVACALESASIPLVPRIRQLHRSIRLIRKVLHTQSEFSTFSWRRKECSASAL